MSRGINNDEELDHIINRVFSSYFNISKHKRLNGITFDYLLESFDLKGRTLTGTKKVIDSYYTYENCYLLHEKLTAETVKSYMDTMYTKVKPTLNLEDRHYQTTLNFVIFTPIDDALEKKIRAYSKTHLLKLGFGGSITVNLIGVDEQRNLICGNKYTEKLRKSLEGELFK